MAQALVQPQPDLVPQPGVVIPSGGRFLSRSYAKIHWGDLALPQGALRVLVAAAAPHLSTPRGATAEQIAELAGLDPRTVDRLLRGMVPRDLVEVVREGAGRHGATRFRAVTPKKGWRLVPLAWLRDPALRILVAALHDMGNRASVAWIEGDHERLPVNTKRLAKRLGLSEARVRRVLRASSQAVEFVVPACRNRASEPCRVCASDGPPARIEALDLALDRTSEAQTTDVVQIAPAAQSETASVAPRGDGQRPTANPEPTIPPKLAAWIDHYNFDPIAGGTITGDEALRRVALAIRAFHDDAVMDVNRWFRWAVRNATDRDFRDFVADAARLLTVPKQLYCERCHSTVTREVGQAGRLGFCDECRDYRVPVHYAAGWTSDIAPSVQLREWRDGDDTEPIDRETFEAAAMDALSADDRAAFDRDREERAKKTAAWMAEQEAEYRAREARAAQPNMPRRAAVHHRPVLVLPPVSPEAAARSAAIQRLYATPEGRARLLEAMRNGTSEALIAEELAA